MDRRVSDSALISAVLWATFAATVLALDANGRIVNYVQAYWRPVMRLVAVAIMALALSVIVRAWVERRAQAAASLTGHSHMPWVRWLLLIPIVLTVGAAPSPLSSAMLANTTTAGPLETPGVSGRGSLHIDYPPLADGQVAELTLEELSDRFHFGSAQDLAGKTVRIIGFVSHDSRAEEIGGPGAVFLNRFKIYCCAADAIAYSVILSEAGDFSDDQWLDVQATIDPDLSSEHLVLRVESATPIGQPDLPYL